MRLRCCLGTHRPLQWSESTPKRPRDLCARPLSIKMVGEELKWTVRSLRAIGKSVTEKSHQGNSTDSRFSHRSFDSLIHASGEFRFSREWSGGHPSSRSSSPRKLPRRSISMLDKNFGKRGACSSGRFSVDQNLQTAHHAFRSSVFIRLLHLDLVS